MADSHSINPSDQSWQYSVEEARASARERYKERLENGEEVGNCSCDTEHEAVTAPGGDVALVVGVRFRDSSRLYFYSVDDTGIDHGDWVVVQSSRGIEPARVVISPRQMLVNQLNGDLRPIERRLSPDDVQAMDARRSQIAAVVRRAAEIARDQDLNVKVIAADYNMDGSRLEVSYSCPDPRRDQGPDLQRSVEREYGVRVSAVNVGPRDEARLIGGLGKCGRSLCCSSWLPYYPDVNMGMARNQDLGLNPGKVTGLCGRLLWCLSYENEQYRQAKRILPRLGNAVNTPDGTGTVISLQVPKELVTIRMDDSPEVRTIPASEVLGEGAPRRREPGNERDVDPQGDDRRRRRVRRPTTEPAN